MKNKTSISKINKFFTNLMIAKLNGKKINITYDPNLKGEVVDNGNGIISRLKLISNHDEDLRVDIRTLGGALISFNSSYYTQYDYNFLVNSFKIKR